jgi:uncharacterized protein (TIGR02145 family)
MTENKIAFVLYIDEPIYIRTSNDGELYKIVNFCINDKGEIISATTISDNIYITWDDYCWREITTNEDYSDNYPFIIPSNLPPNQRESYIQKMTNHTLLSLNEAGTEITIGEKTWSTLNLDVGCFRDGSKISEAKTNAEWVKAGKEMQPAWCYYKDKKTGKQFGKLYNFYAIIDPREISPKGWRVSTLKDWNELEDSFKLPADALKSETGWKTFEALGLEGWGPGTNESKWNGKPGGVRMINGKFTALTERSAWWLIENPNREDVSMERQNIARICGLAFNESDIYHGIADRKQGCYVRIVKEE